MQIQVDLIPQMNSLSPSSQQLLLNAANDLVHYGKPLEAESLKKLEACVSSYENCLDYLGFYIKLIKEYSECEPKEFTRKMILLGYSEDFAMNCLSQLSKLELERDVLFNKLTSFKWRLDVSFFYSKSMKRIPVPIIISLKTNSGEKYVIELDRKAFHKLRFTIVLLIKDLLDLKNLNILKM